MIERLKICFSCKDQTGYTLTYQPSLLALTEAFSVVVEVVSTRQPIQLINRGIGLH